MRIDELIKEYGADYEDLNSVERETVQGWIKDLEKRELTIADIKRYIDAMKSAVENEIIDTDEFVYYGPFKRINRKHILLKARLRNYLLFAQFLEGPERAKAALERMIKSMPKPSAVQTER